MGGAPITNAEVRCLDSDRAVHGNATVSDNYVLRVGAGNSAVWVPENMVVRADQA